MVSPRRLFGCRSRSRGPYTLILDRNFSKINEAQATGAWRNGLRVRLKIVWAYARVGSNPTAPTTQMPQKKLPPKEFIWTPNLAYIVGLLATDGCLSNDGRHIIMRSSDVDLLKTFKKCLGINNKIGETRNGRTISNVQESDSPADAPRIWRGALRISSAT